MKNQRGNASMTVIGGLILLVALAFGCWALASWDKVPSGHVGIKVNLLGGEKGVDTEVVGVGRVFVGWQQELYLYPTFTQTVQWRRTGDSDNSVAFSDTDGTQISADLGMSYRIDQSKAAALFQEFRKPIEDITDGQIRQAVIDSLNGEAGQLKVEDIYGKGREALLSRVQVRVTKLLAPKGIIIEKLSWLGPVRLPPTVQAALNAKIEATQKAQQRENEVQATIAEAVKNREQAKGEADAKLLAARAEAESIRIKGDALRQNQELVQLTIAEKWDGKLPNQLINSGGNSGGPILQLLAPQK
ncbi:transposase [Stenotrophomonas phage vB_SmaS-DLP_6]|nr:transposase [Stenotrophomonas phage vB_SmaS-DLP_6]